MHTHRDIHKHTRYIYIYILQCTCLHIYIYTYTYIHVGMYVEGPAPPRIGPPFGSAAVSGLHALALQFAVERLKEQSFDAPL